MQTTILLAAFLVSCLTTGAGAATVGIFGGGISGLVSAQELASRGYTVTVYEKRDVLGGKARSYGAPGTGTDGRLGLPAEHGFRFFPTWYGATRNTMENIPWVPNPGHGGSDTAGTVVDNLVPGLQAKFPDLQDDDVPILMVPGNFPTNVEEAEVTAEFIAGGLEYITSNEERLLLARRISIIVATCVDRLYAEFEGTAWWDYMFTEGKTQQYKNMVNALSGTLLAANAKIASAHVVGVLAYSMLGDLLIPDTPSVLDMLNGPTSDVWFDPWREHLVSEGVNFVYETELKSWDVQPLAAQAEVDAAGSSTTGAAATTYTHEVAGAVIEDAEGERTVTFDSYISALPVEIVQTQIQPFIDAGIPGFADIDNIETVWMVGVQFYFAEEGLDIINGTLGFLQSPWELSVVSQSQFRPELDLSLYGDGTTKSVISICISNTQEQGLFEACQIQGTGTTKDAPLCSKNQLVSEVWQELQLGAQMVGTTLPDYQAVNVDVDVKFPNDDSPATSNESPIFVNKKGTYQYRPNSQFPELSNFYFAGDWVRAPMNVLCMETANQGSRLATNAILGRDGRTDLAGIFDAEAELVNLGTGYIKDIARALRDRDQIRFDRDGHLPYTKTPLACPLCAEPACMCNAPGLPLETIQSPLFAELESYIYQKLFKVSKPE